MNASCESIISAAMKLAPEDRSQLGMHEWEKAISLYPNPTSTVFNLELTGLETAIQLMDVNGRLIAQREGGEK